MNNYDKAQKFAHLLWAKYRDELGGGTFEVSRSNNFGASTRTLKDHIRIRFDEERLNWNFEKGFPEYKSVMYCWSPAGATTYRKVYLNDGKGSYLNTLHQIQGDKATWALVLHEFAHSLNRRTTGPEYKYTRKGRTVDRHGPQFQQALMRLIKENTYHDLFWEGEPKPANHWTNYLDDIVAGLGNDAFTNRASI